MFVLARDILTFFSYADGELHTSGQQPYFLYSKLLLLSVLVIMFLVLGATLIYRVGYPVSVSGGQLPPRGFYLLLFFFAHRALIGLVLAAAGFLFWGWSSLLQDPSVLVSFDTSYDLFMLRGDLVVNTVNFFVLGSGCYFFFYVLTAFTQTEKRSRSLQVVPEYVILVLATLFGLMLLIAAADFLVFILALEVVSFSVLALMVFQPGQPDHGYYLCIEAAVKYFILNALAVILLLLASCLAYLITGANCFSSVAAFFLFFPSAKLFYFESYVIFVIIFFCGFFLKVGAAPFHGWVPDVYDGSDLLITIFLMAVISPAFLFKLLLLCRTFMLIDGFDLLIFLFFVFFAICSLFVGSFGAFGQFRIKRFLAYASITHVGYILFALSVNSFVGYLAVLFYIFFYCLMLHAFFTLFLLMRQLLPYLSFTYLSDLKIIRQLPSVFIFFIVFLFFSFAGLPPFAGFVIKFFILGTLVVEVYVWLTVYLVFIFLVNSYLYLRFLTTAVFELPATASFLLTLRREDKVFFRQLLVNFDTNSASTGIYPVVGSYTVFSFNFGFIIGLLTLVFFFFGRFLSFAEIFLYYFTVFA